MKSEIIPYEELDASNSIFSEKLREAFATVLRSGWFILGKQVEAFEKKFAAYCGSDYCIGVGNGLDAITLSLYVLSLPKEHEVLVPSNTYIATVLAIIHAGLKPVPVEPDINTYNIDPQKIEESITAKTVAIVVVHLYGKCCNMEKIMKIARQYNLPVIEDCAQAHGAMLNGVKAGNFGMFGAFSFYPTKNLGALGDAGAITTDNALANKHLKMLRNYGSSEKYYNEAVGFNSRLDEMQAAFLNAKLSYIQQLTEHKRNLANIYSTKLSRQFIKPVEETGYYDVFHIYNVRCAKRDELKLFLMKHNIKTEIHYPVPLNRQQAMNGILDDFKTPIADEISSTTLSLPISYGHTVDNILTVCEVMNEFAGKEL